MNVLNIKIEHKRSNITEATTTAQAIVVSSLSPQKLKPPQNADKIPLLATGHLFQLIPLIQIIQENNYKLNDIETAVAAGPYFGTKEQINALNSLHTNLRVRKEHIQCGERGRVHPCTAFHSMILGACETLREKADLYKIPDSKIQKIVGDGLLRMVRKLRTEVELVEDECGIPSTTLSLFEIARLYSTLSATSQLPEIYQQAATHILHSIKNNSSCFAPQSSIEGAILGLSKGDIILRTGENGLTAGVSFSKNSGIAIKCDNGCQRTSALVFLNYIIESGLIEESKQTKVMVENLSILKNDCGKPVGTVKISIN